MSSDFQKFLSEVSSAARKYYGTRLEKIVLFGSYARGEQRKDSDVDLMIVFRDEEINPSAEILSFGKEIYPIGWKYGHWISILPASVQKAIQSKLPVFQNARREGIAL